MPRKTSFYPDRIKKTPSRDPAWRWTRAVWLSQQGRSNDSIEKAEYATEKNEGRAVKRMVDFLRKYGDELDERKRGYAMKEFPDIWSALEIENKSRDARIELRCRVLAGQSNLIIAYEIGSTEEAVEAYCTYFFDVRSRLGAKAFIRYCVLQHMSAKEATLIDTASPSKLPISTSSLLAMESWGMRCSYLMGPFVVPVFLDFRKHAQEIHDLSTLEGRQRESFALSLETFLMEINNQNQVDLIRNIRTSTLSNQSKSYFSEHFTKAAGRFFAERRTQLPFLAPEPIEDVDAPTPPHPLKRKTKRPTA